MDEYKRFRQVALLLLGGIFFIFFKIVCKKWMVKSHNIDEAVHISFTTKEGRTSIMKKKDFCEMTADELWHQELCDAPSVDEILEDAVMRSKKTDDGSSGPPEQDTKIEEKAL